jgi:energy-converting hydrogenase Eha subunit H
MKDKTKQNPFDPIIYFFSRYNLLVFIVIIAAGLSIAILTVASILQIPYTSTESKNNTITFDETTISQINQLNTSANNTASQTNLHNRSGLFSE